MIRTNFAIIFTACISVHAKQKNGNEFESSEARKKRTKKKKKNINGVVMGGARRRVTPGRIL